MCSWWLIARANSHLQCNRNCFRVHLCVKLNNRKLPTWMWPKRLQLQARINLKITRLIIRPPPPTSATMASVKSSNWVLAMPRVEVDRMTKTTVQFKLNFSTASPLSICKWPVKLTQCKKEWMTVKIRKAFPGHPPSWKTLKGNQNYVWIQTICWIPKKTLWRRISRVLWLWIL